MSYDMSSYLIHWNDMTCHYVDILQRNKMNNILDALRPLQMNTFLDDIQHISVTDTIFYWKVIDIYS